MSRPARTMTGSDFNQNIGVAKRAAQDGPVVITDRGRPAHVLLSFEHYRELVKRRPGIAEILGGPPGVADIDFELPGRNDVARAAVFG